RPNPKADLPKDKPKADLPKDKPKEKPKLKVDLQKDKLKANLPKDKLKADIPKDKQRTSLSQIHHNVYSPPQSIPQLEYPQVVNLQPQQGNFLQLDLGLTFPVFKQGDDPIDAINHMMSFLSAVITSCYPTTNNQLRNSSNPRKQATINDGRVTLQPVHRRQVSFATETLMLVEESRSKMLLKQQDPMVFEKKVNTTPVDYAALNQLSQDFEKRFVPQIELSAEQAS
nr:hypothetical protein [Tanacetum cinerariifolium]